MQRVAWYLVLALALAACATSAEKAGNGMLYSQYDAHCRQHAREMVGEVNEAARYEECMSYFLKTDVDCPVCGSDLHLIH